MKEHLERVAMGIFLLASLYLLTGGGRNSQALAEEPSAPLVSHTTEIFELEVNGKTLLVENGVLKPGPIITSEKASAEELEAKREWSKAKRVIEANPALFSPQDLKDTELYFPIFWEAAKKYELPSWIPLPILQKAESSFSRDKKAFTGKNGYVGGMQRDPIIYGEDYVDEAVSGAPEYLFNIETRHPSDIREIYFAARKLRADMDSSAHAEDLDWALVDALYAYSRGDHARDRSGRYLEYKNVFNKEA